MTEIDKFELKKFCIEKALATYIPSNNGDYNQAPILETAIKYYNWISHNDLPPKAK